MKLAYQRNFTLAAFGLLFPLAVNATLAAQTQLRTYNGIHGESHFGSTACALGDVDGDGVSDYAIGSPAFEGSDRISVYSGRTGGTLYDIIGSAFEGSVGSGLANVGDLDGDGASDFVGSAIPFDPCLCFTGVIAYSGVDGHVLYTWTAEGIYDGFGEGLAGPGDCNLDNIPDVMVVAPQYAGGSTTGRFYLYSGADGSLLWSLDNDDTPNHENVRSAWPVGDVNGDNAADIGAAVGYRVNGVFLGQIWILSGLDGSRLDTITGTVKRRALSLAPFGADHNGDGIDDYLGAGTFGNGDRYLSIVSGADWRTPLVEITDPASGWGVGRSGRDLTGDHFPDVLAVRGNQIEVRSGTDLRWVTTIPGVPGTFGDSVAAAVAIGDVNFDGQADVLLGGGAEPVGMHFGTAHVYTSGEPFGTGYCHSAVPNSSGDIGLLRAIGSNAVNDHWLSLNVTGLPPYQMGFFLVSADAAFVTNPGGSQGYLCLGGEVGRFNSVEQIRAWGADGTTGLEIRAGVLSQPTGAITIQAGETWKFQMWYRDVGGNANFSTAVSTTWQ